MYCIIILTGECTHSASKVAMVPHAPVISISTAFVVRYAQAFTQQYESRTVYKAAQ